MILQVAIVNLTRNLDLLIQNDKNNISSNVKLKEDALNCLSELVKEAPVTEYKEFIESENYSILIGYLINILCQISKNDKSRSIRLKSLNLIFNLVEKLENFHQISDKKCSINIINSSLPGVSSILFKLIMSDTKLPKNLLSLAIKVLTKFVTITFIICSHEGNLRSNDQNKEICDNLSIRTAFLIDYITTNADCLSDEILDEILNLCSAIACQTSEEFMNKTIKSIVKYIAFMSSRKCSSEMELKIMIITDNISDKINNSSDIEIIDCLFKLLDELENDSEKLLSGERKSKLSMLLGLLKLMPNTSLTTFMETNERRMQLLKILTFFTEFTKDQPFLFLMDVEINEKALETYDEKIFTFEKRFENINDQDLIIITNICSFIGENLNWMCFNDMFRCDLKQFTNVSNLFISDLILKGCLKRTDSKSKNYLSRFTTLYIEYYSEKIQEEYTIIKEILLNDNMEVEFCDILKLVIAIETIGTLMEIHLKYCNSNSGKTIILKDLLCLLLNWSSSSSRAISEASLSCLRLISKLYGLSSIKSLIEANVDYIVNGVLQMLDNFAYNTEIINVLAITFKLSSLESFYYFRDIYEKIFKLLGEYQSTSKSKSIALLFYRTVLILSEWKEARDGYKNLIDDCDPLENSSSIKSIIYEIDIKRRLKTLGDNMKMREEISDNLKQMEIAEEDERKTIKDIHEKFKEFQKNKHIEEINNDQKNDDNIKEINNKKEKKPTDIELVEKILGLCVNLIGSNCDETKILALKTATCGFKVLCEDENILLPLVHQIWSPLVKRLTKDYNTNLEINLCAFECLISMAICAKDFIKSRTLESIIPRLCLFLQSQSSKSCGKKEYGPYCMTIAYKCQLTVLTNLGALAYHIQLAYSNLWQVMRATFIYMKDSQIITLQKAAKLSLHYLIALDADCAYYFAKEYNQLDQLPFKLIFDKF